MAPRGRPSKLSVEDETALRCKSGPRRRCRRSTSYKEKNQVDGSVTTERLYVDVKRDFLLKKRLPEFSYKPVYQRSHPSAERGDSRDIAKEKLRVSRIAHRLHIKSPTNRTKKGNRVKDIFNKSETHAKKSLDVRL